MNPEVAPMASARRAQASRVPPIEAALRRGLVRDAACGLLNHGASPLVLVAAPGSERLVDDVIAAFTAANPEGVVVADGGDLAADLAAGDDASRADRLRRRFATARVVVIRDLDRVSAPGSQQACAILLDHAACVGTSVCVSLALPPARAGLVAALESRLMAGLVVPLPVAAPPATTPTAAVSVASIIRTTARQRGVDADILVGHGRTRTVNEVRSLAMYLARQLTGRSLGSIGRAFGGRDHTTVMRSVRSVRVRMRADAAFAGDVERLATAIAARAGRRRSAG
jgi:chromosomal replication initiation ATPase DnaA